MKKLIKFKAWLTLEEASSYLTSILEEVVSPADIIQLGLDDYITLSLNIPSNFPARKVKIIQYDDEIEEGIKSYSVDFCEDGFVLLNGILSLPMIADSRTLAMEKYRTLLNDNPEPIKTCKEVIVEQQGTLYSVCQYIMNPEFTELSEMSLEERSNTDKHQQIPPDTEFVIIRQELEGFIARHIQEKNKVKTTVDERSERAYLNIIGGLLTIMKDKSSTNEQKALYGNNNAIISTMLDHNSLKNCYGISLSNLNTKFAKAKQSIESE